jgi:cell division protein FtsW
VSRVSRAVASAPRADWSPEAAPSRLGTGWEAPVLLLLTTLLLCIGIVSVYSASAVMAHGRGLADYHFVVRQATGAAAGFVLLIAFAFIDYRRLRILAWPIVLVTAVHCWP